MNNKSFWNTGLPAIQRGFSLIELMIALTLGLVITGVVVQVFSSSRSTYDLEEGLAEIQEQGRFAMEFLASDIRQSGNFGCAKLKTQSINNIAKSANGPASLLNDPFNPASTAPVGLIAYEYAGAGGTALTDWNPRLPANGFFNALGVVQLIPFSDIMVIQYARPINVQLFNPGAPTNADIQVVNTPETAGAFKANDIIFISDCNKGDIFRATGVSTPGGGAPITISHGVAGNTQPLLENKYDNRAEVMKMATRAYFIGVSPAVSPEPSLYRMALDSSAFSPQPLVEGIEQLKLLIGLEIVGSVNPATDGLAETYMPPSEALCPALPAFDPTACRDMSKVVEVKLAMVVRSSKLIDVLAVEGGSAIAQTTHTLFGNPSEIYRAGPAPGVGAFDPEQYRRRRLFTMSVQRRNK
jgi:type IV pilus assembly protein PilW